MWRFVLLFAVRFCLGLTLAMVFLDRIGRFESLYSLVLAYLIIGVVTGLSIWFVNEYQYQKSSAETYN